MLYDVCVFLRNQCIFYIVLCIYYFLQGIFGTTSWGTAQLNHKVLDELAVLVDSGRLQPVVDKILLPHEAEKAFQHIDSAHSIGKTVIRFR